MHFKFSGYIKEIFEFLSIVLILITLIMISRNVSKMVAGTAESQNKNRVVLDAGHGGDDPGKIGINDIYEKDINLAIAKKVKKRLEKENIEVVMTREKDEMLVSTGGEVTKVGDMKARVAIVNKQMPAITVSIHQNSYPEEEISGAQVFYYTHSSEGEHAAVVMQDALLAADPENHRKAKANDTYYLLKRTKGTTIIVECGFLSNQKEAELLGKEEYQDKIAQAITDGILRYMEK